MAKILELGTALVLCVCMSYVGGQGPKGPTIPIAGFNARSCSTSPIRYVADRQNMCWYHECLQGIVPGVYTLLPRPCALGSRVEYTYTAGVSNPCIFSFKGVIGFECSREKPATAGQRPECASSLVCKNGGTLNVDNVSGLCWCNCTKEFYGDRDCGKATNTDPIRPSTGDETCPNGKPPRDFCADAGGCLNGGNCTNTCDSFWCKCPSPYRFGKRCERFSCARNNECLNGGTCRRGAAGLDEFRRCQCPEGFSGFRCENGRVQPRQPR